MKALILGGMILLAGMLGACGRAPTTPTPTPSPTVLSSLLTATPTNQLPSQTAPAYPPPAVLATDTPSPAAPDQASPSATMAAAPATQVPATPTQPAASPTPPAAVYPPPVVPPAFPVMPGYPGPATPSSALPGLTPTASPTGPVSILTAAAGSATPPASLTTAGTATPTPLATLSGTPLATEHTGQPAQTPPAPGSAVTIWLGWDAAKRDVLRIAIDSFQDMYPDVTFEVLYIPLDELKERYEAAAYFGSGPSLLIGPSEWGAELFESQLVRDLIGYTSPAFLRSINPAALDTGRYQGVLLSLPVAQQGVLLYRNTTLISSSPATFDDLIRLARQATRGGNLGAYLDRGPQLSAAHLVGLGGSLMDANLQPQFNSAQGLQWLELLRAYQQAGTAGLNTNRDTTLFNLGKVGFIIDGSWNLANFANSLGEGSLAIDPWPGYGNGHLSGFIQAESLYLNVNSNGQDQYASLLFMGYLMEPEVQALLAESGLIPSVLEAEPRSPLIQQAMQAFRDGSAYPAAADRRVLSAYWTALDAALQDVFSRRVDGVIALEDAENALLVRLAELRPGR